MSEIYNNTSQYVYLDILGATADATPTAKIGTTDLPVTGPTTVDGKEQWKAVIGFNNTINNGEFDVVWTFDIDGVPTTKKDHFEVVTPLIDAGTIRTELDLPIDITDADIVMGERRVRRLIEKHCGQRFQLSNETLRIRGTGDKILATPKRALSITSITEARTGLAQAYYAITNDGWGIDRSAGFVWTDQAYTVTGVIFSPYAVLGRTWMYNAEWDVNGSWGWENVPTPVQEAALVLLEQRLCAQSVYRDNYLQSITAADWRMQFDPEAYYGTGSAAADHLLSEYIRVRGAVI